MMAVKKGKWARRSRDEWLSLVGKFGTSDLGVDAFCRREGISSANFYRWRSLLSGAGDSDGGEQHAVGPAFVDVGELHTALSPMPRLELKLDLGGGLLLHLVRS